MSTSQPSLPTLRSNWTTLYAHTLPTLARSNSPIQPSWPVHLDHCFGRIILDTTIGVSSPWTSKIKPPAVKNMNAAQLEACIALGERIADGRADLVELDERSLKLRGKLEGGGKRERDVETGGVDAKRAKKEPKAASRGKDPGLGKKQLTLHAAFSLPTPPPSKSSPPPSPAPIDGELVALINSSKLTPFRQRTLLALCQVPEGQYTTYAALSAFLDSCPRAVGSAMRNNPFAPKVPCHRVVASDGGIGGFGGEWGDGGKHVEEKVRLLRGEGVVVVEEGERGKRTGRVLRVRGRVWKGFEEV